MPEAVFPPVAESLADWLAHPQSMRRGSLSPRFMKCGKPGCACATDPKARHGPYFSLTRRGVLTLAARAVKQRLNQDHSDAGGPRLAWGCGALAH